MAIPRSYDNTLFANAPHDNQERATEVPVADGTTQHVTQEHIHTLVEQSKQVRVMGITPNPDKHNTYIIAGTVRKESTGDVKPVAVRVTTDTKIYQATGEPMEAATLEAVQVETVLLVAGKENKHGVIQATSIIR